MISTTKKIPQAAQSALMAVVSREADIKTFDILVRSGHNEFGQFRFSKSEIDAVDTIRAYLHRMLTDAYRNLLMWLHISPESLPEECRVAVVNRYVGSSRAEIMSLLRSDLSLPGAYYSNEREQFRQELDEWFKENTPKMEGEEK